MPPPLPLFHKEDESPNIYNNVDVYDCVTRRCGQLGLIWKYLYFELNNRLVLTHARPILCQRSLDDTRLMRPVIYLL